MYINSFILLLIWERIGTWREPIWVSPLNKYQLVAPGNAEATSRKQTNANFKPMIGQRLHRTEESDLISFPRLTHFRPLSQRSKSKQVLLLIILYLNWFFLLYHFNFLLNLLNEILLMIIIFMLLRIILFLDPYCVLIVILIILSNKLYSVLMILFH